MNQGIGKAILASLLGLVVTVAVLVLPPTPGTWAATLTVNSTADANDVNPGDGICETATGNGICTLRAAIAEANALPGSNTITFDTNVFPPAGLTTITITGNRLPDIEQGNITIDGSEATRVIIDGSQLATTDWYDGFRITSNNNIIRGLTIQNFPSDGVDIRDGAQGNRIENCVIRCNHKRGVWVTGSNTTGNTITQNSITNNSEMGILLSNSGNNWPPRPLIQTVITDTNWTTVTGWATLTAMVEVFADPGGEGAAFLGQTPVDVTGAFTLYVTNSISDDDNVTATATDANGNTSEFGCYPLPRPTLVWPLSGTPTPGGEFSSPYGPRLKASEGFRYDWHRGMDITATVGTSVYAVADGVVRWAEKPSSTGGLIVQIDHESGAYFSTYIHLTQTNVITGQSVSQGDVIGYSGTSDSVPPFPHLHFEIREGGFYQRHNVNPFLYLPYTDTVRHTVAFSAVETAPPVGDSVLVTATVVVTAPRDELDFNAITLEVRDVDGSLLDRRSLDFHARTGLTPYPVPTPDPLDTPCMDGVCTDPARFSTRSDEYSSTFTFGGMQGHCSMTLIASATDVHQNVTQATYIPLVPCLAVTKQASPNPVRTGMPLTYTLHVTNTGSVTLTATITDILPQHVTPTGIHTWSADITAPGGVWTQQVIVTVETGFTGSLTNKVQVTTEESAMGTASVTVCVNYCIIYLPIIFKNSGS